MKPAVLQLFRLLQANGKEVQIDAATSISFLLERVVKRRGTSDELYAHFLSADILEHAFAPGEVEKIFDCTVQALDLPDLFFGAKMTLLHAILKNSRINHGDRPMQFVCTHAEMFTEPQAYDMLAQLTNFIMGNISEREHLRELLGKYNIVTVIESFNTSSSERLRKSASGLRDYLFKNLSF